MSEERPSGANGRSALLLDEVEVDVELLYHISVSLVRDVRTSVISVELGLGEGLKLDHPSILLCLNGALEQIRLANSIETLTAVLQTLRDVGEPIV